MSAFSEKPRDAKKMIELAQAILLLLEDRPAVECWAALTVAMNHVRECQESLRVSLPWEMRHLSAAARAGIKEDNP